MKRVSSGNDSDFYEVLVPKTVTKALRALNCFNRKDLLNLYKKTVLKKDVIGFSRCFMRLHLSEELTGLEVLGPRALMGATLAGSSVAEHFVAPTIKYERPVFLNSIPFVSLRNSEINKKVA